MNVVFDTNVLVSALVFPGGQGDIALRRIIQGQDRLFISKPILDELLGVLARKFSRNEEELAHVAVLVSSLSETVKPRRKLKVLADDPDNRILECALTGQVDMVVTGDKALLQLREFENFRIVSLREYLERLPES